MYYIPYGYSYPYNVNVPMDNYRVQPIYWNNPGEIGEFQSFELNPGIERTMIPLKDYGKTPFVVNINDASKQNNTYRTAVWTGKNMQVTLMSINGGDDIGLEIHPNVDQFLRIEQGHGVVQMGKNKNQLNIQSNVSEGSAIMVPAGTWHNVINTGYIPLKLYSIYSPPEHPAGTVHITKAEAMAAENP